METTEQFALKLTEIADFAFSFGSSSLSEQQKEKPSDQWTPQEMDSFMEKCHEGFKLAQNRLIKEIIDYQHLLKQNKNKIKEFRSVHNKEKTKQYTDLEKVIMRRLSNLSHIADGIAIQMMGQQVHVARRLHLGEKSMKHLEHSNIDHAKREADKINQDPANFALISDLTSFVQIGDLLVIDKKRGLYIEELKEGEVNERIRQFMEISMATNGIPCEDFHSDFTKTEYSQMQRMFKQDLRAAQAVEVINNDRGTDPRTGVNITVKTPIVDLVYYDAVFIEMLKDLNSKEWSYRVLDDCLHIGMYQGNVGLMMAPFSIPHIIKSHTKNFIVVDMMSITEQLSETLFAKPLPRDFVIKLMTGLAKIIIGIDLDLLIEVFNKNGLKTRWLSKKETERFKKEGKKMQVVIVNNRAIGIQLERGIEGSVSWGIISKIVFDNILPSSVALSMATSTGPTEK